MRTHRRLLVAGLTVLSLAAGGCGDGTDPTAAAAALARRPAPPAAVIVSPPRGRVRAGQTLQLRAIAIDVRRRATASKDARWTTSNASVATVSPTGVVTGVAAGSVRIRATSRSVVGSAAITVTASAAPTPPPPGTPGPGTPAPPSGAYTFCTAAGAPCEFIGLRDVRLVGPNGAFVQQTAYHTIPCASYGFGNQNPAPGQALHCEYGPLKTTVLSNPMPGMGGLGPTVTVALGSPGAAGPQTRAASDAPAYTDGSGSFRTTCSLATFAFDDPIVFPGRPGASHLHMFFGNTGVSAGSTPQNLVASGNSTCRGGTLNRSAYWVPALVDSRTGAVQTPDEGVFYYKTGYNVDPMTVRPMPAGLRMIVGDMKATAPQFLIEWGCRSRYVENTGTVPTTCPAGDAVRLTLHFPQCWDGVNLESPEHKNNMDYPKNRSGAQRSSCPPSHPVMLPQITEIVDYPVTDAAAPAYWRLSSDMYGTSARGGLSAHADWMNGWDQATMNTIVTQCLNRALDCGVGSIGNGTALY